MNNSLANRQLEVLTDGDAGPYLLVDVRQLDAIQDLLQASQVSFWVDDAIWNERGELEVVLFNLGNGADVGRVRALLDSSAN